jgi:hypothetical protein
MGQFIEIAENLHSLENKNKFCSSRMRVEDKKNIFNFFASDLKSFKQNKSLPLAAPKNLHKLILQ